MRAAGKTIDGRLSRRDVVPAAIITLIQVAIAAGPASHRHAHADTHAGCFLGSCPSPHLPPGAYVLLVVGPAALLMRRRFPRGTLSVVFAIAGIYAGLGYPEGPAFPSLLVAYATVIAGGQRVWAWASLAAGWAVFLWLPAAVGSGPAPSAPAAAGVAAWLLVVGFGGEVVRARRDRGAAQRRSHEETARRRAEEERLRIARELHDVLAHNISLINIQSGVALHLLDERPEQARSALTIINDASGEALRELRSVLGVLRRVDDEAPRRPTAGLDHLSELVSTAAAAGVDVRTHTDGTARPLATPVDLAAYRIVQESLTNVARHAGGSRATVSLAYGAEALAIEVQDDGPGVGGPPAQFDGGSGNGIVGMRERAASLGGEFDAGPRPGGTGFRVRARLPYGRRP